MPPRRFYDVTICLPPPSRLALDLVEVYFQIVHTRFPLLNPDDFRNRFQSVSFIFSRRSRILTSTPPEKDPSH